MRAVIYARFSTEKQDQSSIGDQNRVCLEYANQNGFTVVARYADEGISGAATGNRPGFNTMLAAALRGEFDVLLVMELSRLSRSAGDLNKTIDRLTFRGVRIVGVSNGYDSARKGHKLQAGVEGVMGEAYRDMIRDKTYDALLGRFDRGLSAGGLSYGYRSVDAGNGRQLEIEPEQADTVRWIFEQYADGRSIPAIVHDLNSRAVPSPRGSSWVVSGIYGSPVKGTGILNNELYSGRYIWNRSHWIKDPDTGIRKRVDRPRSEWRVTDRPDLRIVPADLWQVVRARMDTPTRLGGSKGRAKRPTTLLGGLMRCGMCGGPVVAIDAYNYGCANAKNRGESVCTGVKVGRMQAETRTLAEIRSRLLSPANLAKIQARAQAKLRERTKASETGRDAVARRRAELGGEIDNLTAAIASMGLSAALSDRLRRAETELAGLVEPKSAPVNIKAISDLLAKYRRLLADLPGNLKRDPERARKAISDMLGVMRLVPDEIGLLAECDAIPNGLLLAAGIADGKGSGGRIPEQNAKLRFRLK